jgi:polyhydroxyalkanoate synthesis repressor PhaR
MRNIRYATAGGAMSDQRVIKKYPNRRLYDTAKSQYIRLEDIRDLVMGQVEFIVMDSRTQSDITRGVLLQVIAGQENVGRPVLSREFLSNAIRTQSSV